MTTIHPTAIVEKGAQLDDGVTVGPFAYIGPHVIIGKDTSVGSHSVIEGHTRIGVRNRIFSHAAIGTIPQDLKYRGEASELIIGDDNIIREFTLFNPGTEGGGMVTRIGNGNLFMGYVHLGHDVQIGHHCILANAATLAGHVELGDHVVIGGMSPIHQFVKIGDYAMIAGASAVAQDIPPYCLAQGNRAFLRGLNTVGLRRKLDRDTINELSRIYKELFLKTKSHKAKAQTLLEEGKLSEHATALCRFVATSERGIPVEKKEKHTKDPS